MELVNARMNALADFSDEPGGFERFISKMDPEMRYAQYPNINKEFEKVVFDSLGAGLGVGSA